MQSLTVSALGSQLNEKELETPISSVFMQKTYSARAANITDFSLEVWNSENDPYFSRFLYGVLKVSDFFTDFVIFWFFSTFFTRNWKSSQLWSTRDVWTCSCSGVVYNFVSVNLKFVIKMWKKYNSEYLEKNP